MATHYAAYFSFEEVFQKTELRLEWKQGRTACWDIEIIRVGNKHDDVCSFLLL
jgi:hypothetical protein